jgi:hypothetical protein
MKNSLLERLLLCVNRIGFFTRGHFVKHLSLAAP